MTKRRAQAGLPFLRLPRARGAAPPRGGLLGGALALLVLVAAAAALVATLALDATPRVTRPPAPSLGDVAGLLHAMRVLALGHPSQAAAVSPVVVPQRAAGWLLDQAANRQLPSATQVELRPSRAVVRTSVAVPANPVGGWLNVEAVLKEKGALPAVESLRVGRLALPGWLGDLALRRAAAYAGRRLAAGPESAAALGVLAGSVRHVGFGAGEARIASEWDAATRERIVAALLPPERQQRARAYHDRLVEATAAVSPRQSVPLVRLLVPMFALARERSAAGAPPAQENRAAIQTLALYTVGIGWNALLPDAGAWPAPRRVSVTLAGRDDFPQHWLVSAAIAAEGGGPLADAIGLYKEVVDTRVGSGFSFNDIAVDRAGARFGVRAVEAPAVVQARLAGRVDEADLMPDVSGLPEFMSAGEFARRYGAVGSPAYRRVLETIEARVAALPALR